MRCALLAPPPNCSAGVGQVVLQVAGEARCKMAVGVEKQSIPAEFAKVQPR